MIKSKIKIRVLTLFALFVASYAQNELILFENT
jgi:hypothetical protein